MNVKKKRPMIRGIGSRAEYQIWYGMKRRCVDRRFIGFANYGGRGISVCDRWAQSFSDFMKDMGRRPGKEYSIDRIDNDGNYEPGNCRWATMKQQRANQRIPPTTVVVDGKPLYIWERETGKSNGILRKALRRGVSFEEAIRPWGRGLRTLIPRADAEKIGRMKADGMRDDEIARIYGVCINTVWRYKKFHKIGLKAA